MSKPFTALDLVAPVANVNITANDHAITLTKITSQKPEHLTKTYFLDDAGALAKRSGGQLAEGKAERLTLNSVEEFASLLSSLQPNEALTYGIFEGAASTALAPDASQKVRVGQAISRTRKNFHFANQAGVLMLDYDPRQGTQSLTREELLETLFTVVPELKHTAVVWYPSASSHICRADNGVDLTGLKGQRVYIPVTNAADIERATSVIVCRLWAAGHGFYEVNKAGQLLKRTLVDTSVWQPERLDFAAGAFCKEGLTQRRGHPLIIGNGYLDTLAALPDPNNDLINKAAQNEIAAKRSKEFEAQQVKNQFVELTAKKNAGASATPDIIEQAKKNIIKAIDNRVLFADFVITLADGAKRKEVTIGEVLDKPFDYHGALTLDPLEPDYNGWHVCGKLYLVGGRAVLYSQAHGGATYRLMRQTRTVTMQAGSKAEAVQAIIEVIAESKDIYSWQGRLATVANGKPLVMSEAALFMWLGENISLQSLGKSGVLLKDPDAHLLQILLDQAPSKARVLNGVITSQTLRPNGTVISQAGYDESTGILLDTVDSMPHVSVHPTPSEIENALETIMHPFRDFRFAEELDRSTLLAAMLTASVAPVLDMRPVFAFDAPTQGSGKTLLAKCVANIASSSDPEMYPHTKDEDEIRKRLFTAVTSGAATLIWDNVLGTFNSESMATLITSPTITDRILGKSQKITARNNAMIIMTGNNLTLGGDLPRRVFKCRIDTESATPFSRRFDFNPEDYCKSKRHEVIAACLTVLRGWQSAEQAGFTVNSCQSSFNQWDRLVGDCMAWLGESNGCMYADPRERLIEAVQQDPEVLELAKLFDSLYAEFGDNRFFASCVHRAGGLGIEKTTIGYALEELLGGSIVTTRSIGKMLGYRNGRIAGGYKLTEGNDKSKKCKFYKLIPSKST